MNVWLDDERDPRSYGNEGFRWFKTGEALIAWMEENGMESIANISLDHDLGSGRMTGYDVIAWMERQVADGKAPPKRIRIHTQNPVGKNRMMAARFSIYKMHRERLPTPTPSQTRGGE